MYLRRSLPFVALILASCGGGSGGGSGGVSTAPGTVGSPTPAPSSPTPTAPTPTPTFSYSSFPLQADQTFQTGYASITYSGPINGGAPLADGVATFSFVDQKLYPASSASTVALRSDLLPDNTYLAAPWTAFDSNPGFYAGGASSFTEQFTDVVPAPTGGQREVMRINSDSNSGDRLSVLSTLFPGATPADARYAFRYVSYARWERPGIGVRSTVRADYAFFGFPTVVADVPATGTRTYAAVLNGYDLFATASGGKGTALDVSLNVTVNYATRGVTFSLVLTKGASDPDHVVGTFNGTGTLTAGANAISGTISSSDTALAGTFTGNLFGNQGAEIGLALTLNGNVGTGAAQATHRVAGVVLGK